MIRIICQQPTTDFFWFDGDAIFTKDMVLTPKRTDFERSTGPYYLPDYPIFRESNHMIYDQGRIILQADCTETLPSETDNCCLNAAEIEPTRELL